MVFFCVKNLFKVKTCVTYCLWSLRSSSSPSPSSSQCWGGQPAGTPLFLAGTSQHPPHTRVSGRLEQRLQEPTLSSPSLSSTYLSSPSFSSTSLSSTSLNKDYMRLRCHQLHHLCLFHHHRRYHCQDLYHFPTISQIMLFRVLAGKQLICITRA